MKRFGIFTLFLFTVAANAASAQGGMYRGSATAHVGAVLGGNVVDPVVSVGGAISVQEESGWGAEIDGGYANDNNAHNQEADITTATVSVNWVRPRGPLHPYALAGVGSIGVRGCLLPCAKLTSTWNFGVVGGVGAHYDFNDMFSAGGDVRYFLAPGKHAGTSRPENFGFWRAAFGVSFSWALLP